MTPSSKTGCHVNRPCRCDHRTLSIFGSLQNSRIKSTPPPVGLTTQLPHTSFHARNCGARAIRVPSRINPRCPAASGVVMQTGDGGFTALEPPEPAAPDSPTPGTGRSRRTARYNRCPIGTTTQRMNCQRCIASSPAVRPTSRARPADGYRAQTRQATMANTRHAAVGAWDMEGSKNVYQRSGPATIAATTPTAASRGGNNRAISRYQSTLASPNSAIEPMGAAATNTCA